jgi:hypothetical protein
MSLRSGHDGVQGRGLPKAGEEASAEVYGWIERPGAQVFGTVVGIGRAQLEPGAVARPAWFLEVAGFDAPAMVAPSASLGRLLEQAQAVVGDAICVLVGPDPGGPVLGVSYSASRGRSERRRLIRAIRKVMTVGAPDGRWAVFGGAGS